jgi:hypothetical protein
MKKILIFLKLFEGVVRQRDRNETLNPEKGYETSFF